MESQPRPSVRERLLFGAIAILLAVLSILYATMGGWSVSGVTTSDRLVGALPVLGLSAVTGVGAAALLLIALGRPAWWKLVPVGFAPALVEAAAILTG